MQTDSLFGYKVQGTQKIFLSKITALESAGGDVSKISLYFLDDIFAKVDWNQEPQADIETLMMREALRIRDTYSHVALWYSGGYDSQTVVDAFIGAGVKIDELMIWRRSWVDYHKHEVDYAHRMALDIKSNHWPNVKITCFDVTVDSIAKFYLDHPEWSSQPGCHLYAQKPVRNDPRYGLGSITNLYDRQDTIILEGRDKPILDIIDGAWYARMNDRLVSWAMGAGTFPFFFSPFSPEIHVKQCYLMIKWLETFPHLDHDMLHKLQSHQLDGEMYMHWNRAIGRSPINWHDAKYGTGIKKMVGSVKGDESQQLKKILKNYNPKAFHIYQSHLDEIGKTFLSNQRNLELPTILSQLHAIRKVKLAPNLH